MSKLDHLRQRVRPLLDLSSPAEAAFAYYALYHDPRRTQLYAHPEGAHVEGFVAICQTGRDLFRSVVALYAPTPTTARELLRALALGRPYTVVAPPYLGAAIDSGMDLNERVATPHVYELDPRRFEPLINVLVVTERGPGGLPRFLIRSGGETVAQAGVNWASPHFAELAVQTAPAARRRGWGRAVLAACSNWAVQSSRRALYVVEPQNAPSIALAESVGYVRTGARLSIAAGTVKQITEKGERDT